MSTICRKAAGCAVVALLVLLAPRTASGYGGFGATLAFPDYTGLNRQLTDLNREWSGSDEFNLAGPMWWVGGHGGGMVGDVTLAGGGAATVATANVDSLAFESGGAMAQFEIAYCYAPVENIWIRPCLDLGGQVWAGYVHSQESFSDPNFSRWYLNWLVGVQPGLDVTGWLRYQQESMIGVYVKAGYSVPLYGPSWYGDEPAPDFDVRGLTVSFGLRFNRTPVGPFRI